jgi:hypothetical protein
MTCSSFAISALVGDGGHLCGGYPYPPAIFQLRIQPLPLFNGYPISVPLWHRSVAYMCNCYRFLIQGLQTDTVSVDGGEMTGSCPLGRSI